MVFAVITKFEKLTYICFVEKRRIFVLSVVTMSGLVTSIQFLFNISEEAKKYEAKVPVILNGQSSRPYSYIHLTGELLSPDIQFSPTAVQFSPVPLGTEANLDVQLLCKDFNK